MELKTLQAIAKNNQYWDERVKFEQQWMQKNLADDKAYAAHLNGYYDKALKGIQDKINDQYTRFAGSEGYSIADAVKAVKATDIRAYEKEAAEVVKQSRQMFKEKGGPLTFADFELEVNRRMRVYNATMRINRLEYLKSQIGLEAIKAGVEVNADLAAKLNDDYINEVKRQSGVLGEYTPPASFANGKRAAQVIMANANHNGFSQTLWKNTDAFKADLDIQLNNVMVQGLNGRDMMKVLRQHLSDSVDKARYVTERLARTESARVQAEAQNDIYKELGVTKIKWIAEPSACEQCLDIAEGHGKGEKETGVYSITEAPSIPVHPNCRCSKAPIADRRQMEQLIDAAGSSTSVSESADIDVHVNDAMEKVLGKEDSDEIVRRLKQAPERMQKMWAKYQDRFEIERYDQGAGPHYSPRTKKVTLTPDSVHAANNSSYLGKYDVVYHEFGHAIDYFEMGKDNIYGKISEKNGLGEAMSKDFEAYRDKLMPEILAKYTPDSAGNFFGGLYIKGVKVTFTKKGKLSLPSARQLAEKQIGSEISSQRNWPVYSDVSDMVEAATKGRVSPGCGHGKKYWSYEGMQSTEAFAEMTSATTNNPESLAQIQRMFPNAYKKYLSIVDSIIK